ncbi:MAG: emp24/gp25L/p24 family protein [Alphaproteobacteria bacterium]|nr:emp24/gp25L/p24 family protein [Alphaproteobacteria bacterium]
MVGLVLIIAGGVYLLNIVGVNVSALSTAAQGLGTPTGQLATPTADQASSAPVARPAAEGAAPGITAPPGALPAPATAPAPSAIFYRGDPFGPVKVEAGGTYTVRLGSLRQNTLVRAVATIAFNTRASALTGTPDITITVTGPAGALNTLPHARSGAQISFQTAEDGEYAIVLDNTYSRVTAKQVSLQFLQP